MELNPEPVRNPNAPPAFSRRQGDTPMRNDHLNSVIATDIPQTHMPTMAAPFEVDDDITRRDA